MKIALIGAPESGKSSYFGGVYLGHRDTVTFGDLLDANSEEKLAGQNEERFAFSIGVKNSSVEHSLSSLAGGLATVPMTWPPPTRGGEIEEMSLSLRFHFKGSQTTSPISTFIREVGFFDPPGGVLSGSGINADSIVEKLTGCDAFIVFLDGDALLSAIENGNDRLFLFSARLGKIVDMLRSASSQLDETDVIPVCFIVSKCDKLNENVTKDVKRIVYDELLKPFSSDNRQFMICICPVSLCAPGRPPGAEVFAAHNLEWPFLFSVAGCIFRNAVARERASEASDAAARHLEARASEIEEGGWWKRLTAYLSGSGVRKTRVLADNQRTQSGRLIAEAKDDRELAMRLWRELASKGQRRGVAVLMEGEEVDPSKVAVS